MWCILIAGYWLASPSAGGGYYNVMFINSYGKVSYNGYNSSYLGYGFRPLVCLKSDVHLIEKTNGTTTTYELELD